jgi:hypothetical protein
MVANRVNTEAACTPTSPHVMAGRDPAIQLRAVQRQKMDARGV